MLRRLAPGFGLLAALAAIALFPTGASAARGPCVIGEKKPRCHVWTAKVGTVDDGDTINVNIDGDGTGERFKVRITGLQAMELTRYGRRAGRRGECNGVKAAGRLEQLIRRGRSRVRLAAISPTARAEGNRVRWRRSVAVRQGGRWRDVGETMIEEGLALWFPNGGEWAWNRSYSRLAEHAAASGRNIWNPTACGNGPAQRSPLRLKVKWDAEDNDAKNINGEWVRITNTDLENDVSLARWWFRDSHLRRYTFPRGAGVPAGGSIRLRVGRGLNDPDTLFWGLNESIFENATNDRRQAGDGGYLFDPRGDLRAHVQYPCRTSCGDPLAGKVEIRANYREPEFIRIQNVSNEAISLDEYEMERVPWFYEFRGVVLLPGQTFVLWIQRAPRGGPLTDGWGHSQSVLSDSRDVVTLRNPAGMPVVCDAWGGLRCPRV